MLKEGEVVYAIDTGAGLPLSFRTRHGATSHLDCLEDHVRERCGLVTLRVERVEHGARDVRDELPTLRDTSIPPLPPSPDEEMDPDD